MNGDSRPVLAENTSAERIALAERDGLEPAGHLQPKAEAADAAEQVEDLELASWRPIGAVVARVLAGLGHDGGQSSRPRSNSLAI